MREISVAAKTATPTQNNTADCVFDNAREHPNRLALRRAKGPAWVDVTSAEFAKEVVTLGQGLLSSGIEAGDRIAIMSCTRYEWTLADFAIMAIGAVVVPIYETSSTEQIEWILADSGAKGVFVESAKHAEIVESVRSRTPDLAHVWQFNANAISTLQREATTSADDVHRRRAATTLADAASIIYTSGTTGRPKGCVLLHSSFVAAIDEVVRTLHELFGEGTSTLLFLPAAHVFGREIGIGAIASGSALGHCPDVADLIPSLATFQPTFVLSVPRVFEKVYNSAKQKADSEGKGKIFDLATDVAIRYSKGLDTGEVGIVLKLQHALFDRLVYGKLRAALGGKCEAAVSGGAPLGARLGHFFRGIGVTVYEGYGLTETTGGITVNHPGRLKIGTVGQVTPSSRARTADDGELLFQGPLVFDRYWNNEAATKDAIDSEGWFHTGDIGVIDDEGFVRITGRKKEILVTAGGKNVAPAVMEDRMRAHWLISQCMVVGDGQPYISALVTIDPESFPTWLKKSGRKADTKIADICNDESLREEIRHAIDDANKAVSKAEAIKKFLILPQDWTEATGELTPSMKLKRNVVQDRCAAEIAELYADVQRV